MAPSFIFPPTLHALEDDCEDDRLSVHKPIDISSFRPSELEELVKGVAFDLSDKELFCIEEQDVFDQVYSLVKGFSSLTPAGKFNLVETLRSNFSVLLPNVDSLSRASQGQGVEEVQLLDRVASHRNAFKIYTFFLIHIVLIEELAASSSHNSKVVASSRKKHQINSWSWEPQRSRILTLIANSLEINLPLLFGSSDPDDNYLSFTVKNAFSMFENQTLLKDSESKDALCRIIGTCSTKYRYTAQSCASILHLVHKYDFVIIHLADAVAKAEKKHADGSLATSLIREFGRTNPKNYVKDTVGAENIGRFIVELADKLPKLVSTNIGLLVPHLGGESYKIRNALVGVLGKLVLKAFKDVESEESSKAIRLRTKQAMLDILVDRCRDVSAYTRSRVMQVWTELCEEYSISIGLWNEVASVAAGRLEDKSAIVRKSALNLLIMMLQHNPFGPQLRVSSFEATLEQYKKKLNELEQNANSESVLDELPSDNDICNGDGEINDIEAVAVSQEEQNGLTGSYFSGADNDTSQKDVSVPDLGNLEQTRALIASLEAGLRFSKCISEMLPTLVQLMASSSSSDVENSILLLMRCKQFQIDGSENCLRKMLPLAFSQDKSIYEAVENAFITIYIGKSPEETAKNIIHVALESNIGDLAALEFIVGALVSKGDITSSTISALWDFFCFNISGTTPNQSSGALSVLCMAAKSSTTVLSSHIQDIIDIGFGRWAKSEPLLARSACIALQRLSEEDKKKMLSNNGSRVFGILESLITKTWLSDNVWYAAAAKAIDALYAIHPTPEALAASIVKQSLSSVFNCSEGDGLENDIESDKSTVLTTVQVAKLCRYLFVVSHIALNQLVYIESCVRKVQKEKAKKEKLVAEGQNSLCSGVSDVDTSKDSGISAELGLAASDDQILDSLAERTEREIIANGSNGSHLIGYCAPFLSKICRNFSLMQKHPELQASGMLALCRFMIIDAAFCEANLQLLFTVVDNAPSEIVRSNCTIAIGDLVVRFPNLLEPWTEKVYARLRDPAVSVRKNSVLVLSHLILNDMMKVKGYINEMATRLEDEDERISNLAKLFFHELSKKGSNPIYNLLPDILGKLSHENLTRESFGNIMQFLINSIKRDKQMDSLVEKLCNRFNGLTDIKQCEYISYCLSQLTFTEKGMKKLMESFKVYEHVLSDDRVLDNFKAIISKGKKFGKQEMKACIEEFEEKLTKYHIEKKEQEITAKNAQIHQEKLNTLEEIELANIKEESLQSEISEVADVEINVPTKEEPKSIEKNEHSPASSVTESECSEEEVQSTATSLKGASKLRSKRTCKAVQMNTSALAKQLMVQTKDDGKS